MNKDTIKYLRHELRTFLNHIIGYSEILVEDVRDTSNDELIDVCGQLAKEAEGLQKVFMDFFFEEGRIREEFNPVDFKRNLFGPLYILIGTAQKMKKSSEDLGFLSLVKDVDKVLDSARKVLDLVEQEIRVLENEKPKSSEEYLSSSSMAPMPGTDAKDFKRGSILIVDDNELNRDILHRHLERQGHVVSAVDSGYKALEALKDANFDLVLLDILMPGLNGYQVLEKMKQDTELRHIPVIMISALDEMDSVAHCITLGAEDYLPKSFDPIFLRARISACLSKKYYRDQEQKYIAALLESRMILEKELADAADYVTGLLPRPMDGEVKADWLFIPSAKLGGDCFDYHWLNPDLLAIYLLDVSGHGIGAALLSVSVMNVLRTQGLPHTDFGDPSDVLGSLNQMFQMDQQNNMYFTIWYGVYNKHSRILQFASAGAPPALLVHQKGSAPVIDELTTTDMIIGVDMDYSYETKSHKLEPHSRLYLFSDGAYEVKKASGKMLVFKEFVDIITYQNHGKGSNVTTIYNQIQGLCENEHFDDDFSLLELIF